MPLHLPDPLPRPIDERPRFYRITTPRGVALAVEMGGDDDPVDVTITRPLDAKLGSGTQTGVSPAFTVEPQRLRLSREEACGLWAGLSDGLTAAGVLPPEWAMNEIPATGADGTPLPAAPSTVVRSP